ncbi:tetratricopeptide repeat protein [Salegentibacter sp. F188]|uniref:Tetratricopeptide repeat protein n=1 Tax=Autumnicola patrickiae TaxID=3075591 RepID=A0ABU3E3T3_9FLAO|nr:tetratricopeptide repeat protein [Salegentibacter sp. F188]MDT0690585.1 tetratricopeptide repeat protein [Salegentibacter sp. F188]
MKTNILTLALSFLSLTAFAQKSEIRDAGNAVEDGSYSEAQQAISQAEPMLSEANDRWTERFYLYKGQAYLGTGENVSLEDLNTAAQAFQKAADMGSEEAQEGLIAVRNSLVQGAISDQNAQNFSEAAEKLHTSYQLSGKNDTIHLYYAANNAVQAGDYDTGLEYLNLLKDEGYDGSSVEYLAVNTDTGEEEIMGSKEQRDLMIKTGDYSDPSERQIPSKKGDIAGLIARIYISEERFDEAIEAMDDAKRENPNDIELMQAEANMYYSMGEKEKYNEIMEEVIEIAPDNASLYYNLGVNSADLGNKEKAMSYYEKAIELDPDMTEARMNIVALVLSKERDIIEEMNNLGTSQEDNNRYDELQEERNDVYKEAVPYLETLIEKDPTNLDAIRTAKNIHGQLGNEEKVEEMNTLLENATNQ